MRLITGATAKSNICNLYAETGWLPTKKRPDTAKLIMVFKKLFTSKLSYRTSTALSTASKSLQFRK